MPYWFKRIILKSGKVLTERELPPIDNRFDGEPPFVGDVIATVVCKGRTFSAKVVWREPAGSKRD